MTPMLCLLRGAVVAAAVVAVVPAQPYPFVSSPVGFEYVEGGGDSRDLLGTEARLRYQQIDSTTQAPLLNRNRLAFRRDGRLLASSDYGARLVELEVVLAESSLAQISSSFAANRKANVTTVVNRKQVQFPDWTNPPVRLPAPADLVLLLDQGWSYAGKQASGNDWLWEARVFNNDQAGKRYPFDFEMVVPNATFGQLQPQRSGHIDLGYGCQVPLRGESHMDIDIWNYGVKFRLDSHLHTVANAPVVFTIGFFNANLTVPGFCTKVYALPGLSFFAGVADANGDLDLDVDPLPYNAALIGTDLYAQAAAPDPSQAGVKVALSSGAKMTVPGPPQGPAIGRLWAKNANASTATFGPLPGGIVVQTNRQ